MVGDAHPPGRKSAEPTQLPRFQEKLDAFGAVTLYVDELLSRSFPFPSLPGKPQQPSIESHRERERGRE